MRFLSWLLDKNQKKFNVFWIPAMFTQQRTTVNDGCYARENMNWNVMSCFAETWKMNPWALNPFETRQMLTTHLRHPPANPARISPAVATRVPPYSSYNNALFKIRPHALFYLSSDTKAFARSPMCVRRKRGEGELCATISLHTLFRLNLP